MSEQQDKLSENYKNGISLKNLLQDLPVLNSKVSSNSRVFRLTTDSRRVIPGSLFFAIKGLRENGNTFTDDAIGRGAVAVISEDEIPAHTKVPYIQVENAQIALAQLARKFYNSPDEAIKMVGITGTNGKTTVSMLAQYFLTENTQAGLLGTVRYDLGNRTLPSHKTTPESADIYSMLATMNENGCKDAILEVSSHGLIQHRTYGIKFDIGVFLNLSHEHLDYHNSLDSYFDAKASLFDGRNGHTPKHAVINIDDAHGQKLVSRIPQETSIITFGTSVDADIRATNINLNERCSEFTLCFDNKSIEVKSPLLGGFNISNLLAAFAILKASNHSLESAINKLPRFEGVPGRMEPVTTKQPFSVLIDYAHTPDALEVSLKMLKSITKGRILVVFGCGGNRDKEKRPLMTRAVLNHADKAWATSDNPRTEAIADIFKDMVQATTDNDNINFIEDRRQAISNAIDECQPQDCLLIAGKGHENFQVFEHTIVPFDDAQTAKELLKIKQLF